MRKETNQSYQLHIRLETSVVLRVGKLGTFSFPAGWYIYTGSARKNIEARVRRHLSKTKRMRWHIDYLLANLYAGVMQVKLSSEEECDLNQKTKGRIVVRGFGSSDCYSHCGSHLKFSKADPLV